MKKKLKGSALLWSVCALLIVVFVLTGLLALNKAYAEEEINNIAARRAEYYARSGIELTADMIKKGTLTGAEGEGSDSIFNYVISSQTGKRDDGTYDGGEAPDEKKLEVTFNLDGNEVTVLIERTGDEALSLRSSGKAGYMSRTVTGIMKYDSISKKWEFGGYATN
ncbi:MAG: hypothetical protein J6P89_01000 [Oscillospiraceae bacterium]|nr:hypothetical protein [Oscillospiraceae bacterium]MBP1590986.1 hypothetical protein [Oscillospiraceae bacterium]